MREIGRDLDELVAPTVLAIRRARAITRTLQNGGRLPPPWGSVGQVSDA
jgi:hypothetical protein